jgi:hypothetical protein
MSGLDPNGVRAASRIAENEPTRFPATERSVYVRDMIRTIERYQSQSKTTEEIKSLVPEFFAAYPRLFEMATKPNYDKSQLRAMIAMLERMGSGELSQHQASIIVGQKLVNTYVTPTLRGTTNNR